MATAKTSTPKTRTEFLVEEIRATAEALSSVPMPAGNSLCSQGSVDLTLDAAHELLAFLDAVELTDLEQLPDCSRWVIRRLRAMATEAIKYSYDLVQRQAEMLYEPSRG